jgi:uncharacterized protein (TIGR00255 family)
MPVYSMTGFACAQNASSPDHPEGAPNNPVPRLSVEIRSVNSRFLDLTFRLPGELRQAEPALRELLGSKLKRGKVELRAALSHEGAVPLSEPSMGTLQKLASIENKVRSWLPQAQPLSVADVLKWGALPPALPESMTATLAAVAQQAVDNLQAARAREGAKLCEMLQDRLGKLQTLADQAEPLIPELVAQQRQRFLQRWHEAMDTAASGATSDAAQDRALAEATAFAIRIDVAEELTRLRAHVQELSRLLGKGGEIGKRLDFLIQELHREANTMGSKSAALELTHISVDMKVLIEQMREQVQNIE